jgi:hypothetical protein
MKQLVHEACENMIANIYYNIHASCLIQLELGAAGIIFSLITVLNILNHSEYDPKINSGLLGE